MRDLLGKKLLIFDGATGTMLQRAGLRPGDIPELWNVTHADAVIDIHRRYLDAGCDIVTANTFGCNRHLLGGAPFGVAELVAAGIRNAKEAVRGFTDGKPRFVALDLGPSGRLLAPVGDLGFEEAVELYREPVLAGAAAGADLILIETLSDTYELKAAVLAAKENTTLPVIASVTLDARGRLLTGGDIAVAAAMLEGLRVDAIGINCSLGPSEMLPHLEALLRLSSLPVLFMPNAGLPCEHGGETVYNVGAPAFGALMRGAAQRGAWLLGGCCGTTPEHIAELVKNCADVTPPRIEPKRETVVCSYGRALEIGAGRPVLIGERINPTGKARLKTALLARDYDYVLREGIAQQEQGADALDVNAGLPELDEGPVLAELTALLQAVTDLPLQLDSADAGAMAQALRLYNGKPLINSVNGKDSAMDAVFPLVQRYGGVVIALTLDDSGIPETADGRLDIARHIVRRAAEYGIGQKDLVFDALAMAVSAGDHNALVTLETIRRIKSELGAKTSLGVSNISFGLPRRDLLNAAFFSLALEAGLDAAILNPHAASMRAAAEAFSRGEKAGGGPAADALLGRDPQFQNYIALYSGQQTPAAESAAPVPQDLTLRDAIAKGLKQQAALCAQSALAEPGCDPLALIENELIFALNEAGKKFETGELFLPQLLMCAEAAKAAFAVIKETLGADSGADRGAVVVATVEGDVHDIGKNIVSALLENYRFKVIDLGKNVPPHMVVEAAKNSGAALVGLSALMTTTVPAMEKTIAQLHTALPGVKVMVGGAVLSAQYAAKIGADHYAPDAMSSVRYAQEIYGG